MTLPQSIPAPRIGMSSGLWVSWWECLLSVTWPLPSPKVPAEGGTGPWDGVTAGTSSASWRGSQSTQPHSTVWALVMCLASSQHSSLMCTNHVVGGGVHWMQLQALPCKLALPPSGFLHQGTLKESTWRDVQGSDSGISGSDPQECLQCSFLHMVAACYGAGAPTGTGPILAFGWRSSLGVSPCSSYKNNWLQRVWSATLFKQLVLWSILSHPTSQYGEVSII